MRCRGAKTVKSSGPLHCRVTPAAPLAFAVAHRGLWAGLTENTIAAFQAAAAAGFSAVEMDLRTTRDGEVVVLHDAGIERTTNGNGRVADMSYDELRTYQTPHGPVPRLDDLFAAMRLWHGLWNLEIKALNATEPTLHLVAHHDLLNHAQISSFDPRALEIARDHAPDVARALIVAGPPDVEDLRVAKELGCAWLNVDHNYLTPEVAADLLRQGFRLGSWTVNDPDKALALAQRGVEAIITDTADVWSVLPHPDAVEPYF